LKTKTPESWQSEQSEQQDATWDASKFLTIQCAVGRYLSISFMVITVTGLFYKINTQS
jgi:hypothetical protein